MKLAPATATDAPDQAPARVADAPTQHADARVIASTPVPATSAGTSAGAGRSSGTSTGVLGAGVGTNGVGGSASGGAGSKSELVSGESTSLPFMDGMTRPQPVTQIDIEYTREARDAGVEGVVLTKCVIDTAGRLQRCRILKGLPLMDGQVLSALANWRYSPVFYQGRAVAVEYVIPVRLKLPR
jgi:TonB family protein